ncbi:LacI family DNA-binding transcriptional regulator [Streptomyces capparidis]
MKRPTIADIARTANVSKGAVSYALNGKPGVSENTRRRILDVAAQLGWQPSSAARALSDGRSGAVGLVVDRPARVLSIEPFFMDLISGMEQRLAESSAALLLKVTADQAAELAAYRRWWAERRVDGVILLDVRTEDPRLALVRELGLPTVVIGRPDPAEGLPCVWVDDAAAMREVVEYLAALGHRRITHVAGPGMYVHTQERAAAFAQTAARLGLERARTLHTDYGGEAGARATRQLLADPAPPTAIIYDNDVMAVAALGVAQEMGVSVPERLSLVAWDDSALCQLVHPALTAVRRNVVEHGSCAVASLLRVVSGEPVGDVRASGPVLVPRRSTAPL